MVYFDYDAGKGVGILTGDHFNEIREHFSVKNEGARFARARGRFIPSRIYAITPTGRVDPGMFNEITKFLLQNEYCAKNDIKASKEFIDVLFPGNNTYQRYVSYTSEAYNNLALKLRDYQKSIVSKCLNSGRGTVILATAGGKTLVIASLLSNFYVANKQFKCLLIVPDLGLVTQTYSDFQQYKVPFFASKWTGNDSLDLSSNVVIANLGILQSEKTDLSWIEHVDILIFDEVHKARRGNEVNKIIKNIKTQVRFGFTGTMPEDRLDQWNIIGKIGPILYEKNSFQLRQEKYVSNVIANVLEVNYATKPDDTGSSLNPSERYRKELQFLFTNKFRNKTLATICNNAPNNVLILIDFIDHGLELEKILNILCTRKQVYFIRGEVEVEDRDKIRFLMEQNNNIVVVAISKIFSTGVNIKNLHYIIFAGGGKAKIKTIQSIGRGLRLHYNKDRLYIIDIADQLTYGKRHQLKRQTFYEQENIAYQIKKIEEKQCV